MSPIRVYFSVHNDQKINLFFFCTLGCLIVALLNVENESKFFFEYSTLVVFIKFT